MHGDPWGSRRVYLSPDMARYCLVDAVDFEWAMQWRWHAKVDKRGKKFYAVRHGRRTRKDGRRVQIDLYMHKEILSERMGKAPPTAAHVIGDHGDGGSLNNCRENLDWATHSHNCKTAKVKTPRDARGQFRAPDDALLAEF